MPCLCLNHSFSASNLQKDADTSSSVAYSREVLPDNVVPEHYELELKPCLDSFTFDGLVEISITVIKTTNEIRLNAKDLIILSGLLITSDGK